MRPDPILFVDHAHALGGAERSLLLLMSHLPGSRWPVHLACARGALHAEATRRGLPAHIVALPRLRRSLRFAVDWISKSRALARLAQDTGAAAIYANTVRAAFYCSLAARLSRRPLIWHMRDFWLSEEEPSQPAFDSLGKRWLMSAANLVITNSSAVAANLPPSQKVKVVHNGIDLREFSGYQGADDFRSAHNLPPQAALVGMVGRLRPWKGQERFLRVAARVLESHETAYFLIVGGSPFDTGEAYLTHLKDLARQMAIAGRLRFTGQLDDVRPALAAMDVFVHPGEPEPFGLVNIEAMAMGLPVVAFAHGALPEIVEDGKTGTLVAAGNEPAMARAVCDLLTNPNLRHRMSEAARDRVARNFSIERVANDIDSLLQQTLAQRR